MTIDELLIRYRDENLSEHDKGIKFERLMKNFLLTYPVYRGKFSDVWLWNDFPFREELGGVDLGIDIVCKTADGDFWAVQCKFYAESTPIIKSVVDTFLATSSKTFDGDKKFSARLWISTSDNLTDNAEITLQNQSPEVLRIGMEELRKAAVDWEKLDAGTFGDSAVKNSREPLQHQLDAINAAQIYFQNHARGKLIMACGTGKTYTSLKIAEKIFPNGKILFLVPSISLLSQILYEWATFAENPFNYICVCSDETVSKKTEDEIKSVNLPAPATTNPEEISRRFNACAGLTVIFSTYQSLDKVSAAKIAFDLIICDEAHRTTGYGKESTPFTFVHDDKNIRGEKRLYMTATPKLYKADAKKIAVENDLLLWSMDDESIFGEEFFHIGFGEAIRIGRLADYKVIVLTVDENNIPESLRNAINDKNSAIKTDDALKLIGCINALSKRVDTGSKSLIADDKGLMHTAVAFCPKISYSEYITEIFSEVQKKYCADMPPEVLNSFVEIQSAHIDGTMPADKREKKLSWLKNTPLEGNICRVLSNVRCLSEGVDVPTLDAVLFLSSKKSKVEIVQAVGRALRTARDKKYGYIIIPVVIPANKSPELALDSSDFKTVWDVLNALRAHDERIDAEIQRIAVKKDSDRIIVDKPHANDADNYNSDDTRQLVLSELLNWHELRDKIYARMVEHVGNRLYWVQWAQKVAAIVERHISRISELISVEGEPRRAFYNFLHDLQRNLNPSVTTKDAIEMLAQHLITRPVFEALFENYSFVQNNPVSKAMQEILDKLDEDGLGKDRDDFAEFYRSVCESCQNMGDAANRQRIINRLYNNFFKMAMPLTVERLGIVYSPVEVVDFILRSVDAVLKEKFNRTLADKDIHIIEPFAGTGTFIVRIIQLNLIPKKDLIRKYKHKEIWANEIMLLAYYIAAVNIENAFHDAAQVDEYIPFPGICLTDTFQAYEDNRQQTLDIFGALKKNSERVEEQKQSPIKIIICNPPYSVGQRSANDNNQNNYYPNLERRISETYAAKTNATNKNSLYDSYIKAFRWASDRIDEGIIGFVTNAGWLDGAAMDGLRKCFEDDEFAEIYVFNLRGNARTQGELRRKEGGNVFGEGTRTPVSILILVKREHDGKAQIFYRDIGDYLSRDEKLSILNSTRDVLHGNFEVIIPNDKGDWINQRGDDFDSFIPLNPDKKFDGAAQSFFVTYSNGLKTQRDAYCYNFSRINLGTNIEEHINAYNEADINSWDFYLSKKVVWTRETKKRKIIHEKIVYDSRRRIEAMYRPFCKEYLYYNTALNEMIYQMDKFFPNGTEENLLICIPGISGTKDFSVFITNKVTDLHLNGDAQCFPFYWYRGESQIGLFEPKENYFERRDGISDFILNRARLLYGIDVTREDIFYYVYGFLHLPSYREKFSAELKKSLPRITLVKEFWELSREGRQLAEIHLNYEAQPAPNGVEVVGSGDFRVKKMRLSKDKTTLLYNDFITIKNIPARVFEYKVNGRSPLEWIIDRYQIKTDKASGIVNNPNDWATEHGNPRYILDLLLSSMTVSLKTLDIVENLPAIEF